MLCDGAAVSRTTYAKLFSVIGTAYGSGDGSTTFNVPNFTGRLPQGNGQGYKEAGLPNITGGMGVNDGSIAYGAFTDGAGSGWTFSYQGGGRITFDASRSSSIYGNSDTVQPPACLVNFIIKC